MEVRPPYFLTECEHCGWRGSSEDCGLASNFDDADVICPKCHRVFLCDEVDPKPEDANEKDRQRRDRHDALAAVHGLDGSFLTALGIDLSRG